MSIAPFKTNLPIASLESFLFGYLPNSGKNPEEWAAEETSSANIGDLYLMLRPVPIPAHKVTPAELEVFGAAFVFRKQAGFAMAFYVDHDSYEMGFLENILCAKAAISRLQRQNLYCFRLMPAAPLTADTAAALSGMHQWGGSGKRDMAPNGLPDPIRHFFQSFQIAYPPVKENEMLSLEEIALCLLHPKGLSESSAAPRGVDQIFLPAQGKGALTISILSPDELNSHPDSPQSGPITSESAESGLLLSFFLDESRKPNLQLSERNYTDETVPAGAELPESCGDDAEGKLSDLLEKIASETPMESVTDTSIGARSELSETAREQNTELDNIVFALRKFVSSESSEKVLNGSKRPEIQSGNSFGSGELWTFDYSDTFEDFSAPSEAAIYRESGISDKEPELKQRDLPEEPELKQQDLPEEPELKQHDLPEEPELKQHDLPEQPEPESYNATTANAEPESLESGLLPEESSSALVSSVKEEAENLRPQKKLSLHATVSKLEEQSKKAQERLDEFRKSYEEEFESDRKLLEERCRRFEESFVDQLASIKQSALDEMFKICEQARVNIRATVAGGLKTINESASESVSALERVGSDSDLAPRSEALKSAILEFKKASEMRLLKFESLNQSGFEQLIPEELSALQALHEGCCNKCDEASSLSLSRMEQRRTGIINRFESSVSSLLSELSRSFESSLDELSLFAAGQRQRLEQSLRLLKMHSVNQLKSGIAQDILPLLAETNRSLRLKSHRLKTELDELILRQADALFCDFAPLLNELTEAVTLLLRDSEELKLSVEKSERMRLDAELSQLKEYFEHKCAELAEIIVEKQKSLEPGLDLIGPESAERTAKLRQTCLSELADLLSTSEAELSARSQAAMGAWDTRVADSSASAAATMIAELESCKKRRRDSIGRLQDRLSEIARQVNKLNSQLVQ